MAALALGLSPMLAGAQNPAGAVDSSVPAIPGAVASSLGDSLEAGRATLRFLGMRVYEAVLWIPVGPVPRSGIGGLSAGSAPGSPDRAVSPAPAMRAAPAASESAPTPPGPSAATLSAPFDRDFVLELRYAMELSGKRIAERSDQEIARQPERATDSERARWLERMQAIFPDVRAGDRIAGVYRVNGTTRFFLNDRLIGEVAEPAFGRAFFGIWLDPRTSEPAMRDALLRGLARISGVRARSAHAVRSIEPGSSG